MHVITQSAILFLWMQTLTFVKSQDCTLQQFLKSNHYDEHFDTSNLDASYSAGKQVRVSCNVGYSGFFKLFCVEGTWQARGTKCQPKSCGHPGDAQFADFALVDGDDFVFGSQVVYTCHKGYQMVSRNNFRRCMAGGWDGVVPVCEAQQCPVIYVDDNVLVTGDPNEATYGNVVRFSCKSNSEILDGPVEIYCDENGVWSAEAPKCKEIKCDTPVIENGNVPGKKQQYNEHEVLHFQCNLSFKRAEDRPSKCTKFGSRAEWSPTPLCEPIKCRLSQSALEGTTYDPAYRNVFSPGDTLRVICGQKYWISEPQYSSVETRCQEDGEWTIRPVCQEVRCSNQRPTHVYSWNVYWGQLITLDETVRYTCRSGYKSPDGRNLATCTRNGWRPDPICQAVGDRCTPPPKVENAVVLTANKDEYLSGSEVTYHCHDNYTMVGENTIQCKNGTWEKKNINCTQLLGCGTPPFLEDGDIKYLTKSHYDHNERAEFMCQPYYTMEGDPYKTCINGEWTGHMRCIKPCIAEEDTFRQHNIILKSSDRKYFTHDEYIEFKCTIGVPVGKVAMHQRCNSGVIHLPTCQ